jgi:hypothetical protein
MRRCELITLLGGASIAFAKDDRETEERLAGFRQGLAKRGWVEGRNIHIDYAVAI